MVGLLAPPLQLPVPTTLAHDFLCWFVRGGKRTRPAASRQKWRCARPCPQHEPGIGGRGRGVRQSLTRAAATPYSDGAQLRPPRPKPRPRARAASPRRHSQVVRLRIANPSSPVRIRVPPPAAPAGSERRKSNGSRPIDREHGARQQQRRQVAPRDERVTVRSAALRRQRADVGEERGKLRRVGGRQRSGRPRAGGTPARAGPRPRTAPRAPRGGTPGRT